MAVFAKDGMYVITGKLTAEKNAKLIEFMAKQVTVTGARTLAGRLVRELGTPVPGLEALGLSQERLAELTGVTRAARPRAGATGPQSPSAPR